MDLHTVETLGILTTVHEFSDVHVAIFLGMLPWAVGDQQLEHMPTARSKPVVPRIAGGPASCCSSFCSPVRLWAVSVNFRQPGSRARLAHPGSLSRRDFYLVLHRTRTDKSYKKGEMPRNAQLGRYGSATRVKARGILCCWASEAWSIGVCGVSPWSLPKPLT